MSFMYFGIFTLSAVANPVSNASACPCFDCTRISSRDERSQRSNYLVDQITYYYLKLLHRFVRCKAGRNYWHLYRITIVSFSHLLTRLSLMYLNHLFIQTTKGAYFAPFVVAFHTAIFANLHHLVALIQEL